MRPVPTWIFVACLAALMPACTAPADETLRAVRATTEYSFGAVIPEAISGEAHPACGDSLRRATTVVLFGAEQCFECLGLGRALREAGAGTDTSRVAVMTRASDSGPVCDHLRREGLARIPVLTFADTSWTGVWPTTLLWTTRLDPTRTHPARTVLVPRADRSMVE